MIWFKHCYWPEPDKWGVLGLPNIQRANTVLKNIKRGQRVLLALTVDSDSEHSGKFCWVCTLLRCSGQTSRL